MKKGIDAAGGYYKELLSSWGDQRVCENCEFWNLDLQSIEEAHDDCDGDPILFHKATGECRRYPPHPVHGHATTEDWHDCGEWSEKSKEYVHDMIKCFGDKSNGRT